ncbi:MAG: S8 family peptidase [Anaerolineae bacterium]|nr:S8 family peptidase [Anaerolineae bacterium]
MRKRIVLLSLAVVLVLVLVVNATAMAGAAPPKAPVLLADPINAVAHRYIVVLKDTASARAGRASMANSVRSQGGVVHFEYTTALNGFSATLNERALTFLQEDPLVDYIEQDQIWHVDGDQSGATWGIDRVDQRALPLSRTYHWDYDGSGVHAYIIDTGIRISHNEFRGRASYGYNAAGSGVPADDHGHGTHVAGTVGGSTYGIAKAVNLYAVKVCDSGGSCPTSSIVAGIDWVTNNHQNPAVANMSLGGSASTAIDSAVRNSVSSGVFYAVAAGNSNRNACYYSPSRVDEALTVGATTSSDSRSSFSNYGSCVDIFAPGSSILSAYYSSDSATATMSGTSMASPHGCGVAALVRQANPGYSVAQVFSAIVDGGTSGRLSNIGTGSPNLLLYSLLDGGTPVTPSPTPIITPTFTPTPLTPPPGGTIFFDDFESSTGWVLNPNGTDTATIGVWERTNPDSTSYSGTTYQLGTTVSGSNDLVTGGAAGSSVGSYDIDGGVTSARSPNITLPGGSGITLSFSYYLAHYNNASSSDYLRVRVVGSTTSTVFEEVGAANIDGASWSTFSINLDAFAGQTIYLLIEAADSGTSSLVEAAIDDVLIAQ